MKKIVVKIGSSVIAPQGKLDSGLVSQLVQDVLWAEEQGYKAIIVSSGAIACGMDALGLRRRPQDTYALMAISSLGQILLMDVFNAKFKRHNRRCAQILLTWDDFDNRKRFMNVRKTIDKLLGMNAVPIVNENDAVSYEEIRLGDNDCISARLADLSGAERLIILSDVVGLLDGTALIKEVTVIDENILALARQEDKTHTSGGMQTKLVAARIASASGIQTTIAYGREKNIIQRILQGENVGTSFIASKKISKARKRWIIFSKKVKGRVFIDDGAKAAIVERGKSLLGVGIIKASGTFSAGDCVEVVNAEGVLVGYGIVNYDSASIAQQKKFAKEVVHRDNFVRVSRGYY